MTLLQEHSTLQTERLILRRFERSDLKFLIELHSDPDVSRFLGTGVPRTADQTALWLEETLDSYHAASLGQLAATNRHSGELVGRCGLVDSVIETGMAASSPRVWFHRNHAPPDAHFEAVPELGYTFARSHWGQGLASEAASAVLDYVRGRRNVPTIMAVIHPANTASAAIASKLGATLAGNCVVGDRELDVYRWVRSAGG